MSAHPHSKIEHFLIHLVAVLFLFSSVSAAYLGYGVYQTDYSPHQVSTAPIVQAAGLFKTFWNQNNWSGGTSSSTYTVSWGTDGGWANYGSGTSVVVDGNGIKDDGSGTGEFISSVFDLGNERLAAVTLDNSATVQVRGASTTGGVSSASWQSLSCPFNYRYVQYKLTDLPQGFNYVSLISLGTIPMTVSGTVTNAATESAISNATISYGSNSTTTALLPPKNFFFTKPVQAAGPGPIPNPGTYSFTFPYETTSTFSITAQASGYQSLTKNVSIPKVGTCYYSTTVNFSLVAVSSSGSSSNTSNSSTTSEPSVSTSSFQSTKLPSIFTAAGSKTTDLSKVTDPKKVAGFTLDVPGKNTIVFKGALDLSGQSTVEALRTLDKYVKMTKIGAIEVDSKTLKALNKKATLTMYGLKQLFTPVILIDGQKAKNGIVSKTKYDKIKGTLTFDVIHFTKFEAGVKIEILSPISTTISSQTATIKGRVSDPTAIVSGQFNGVKLAKIIPDKKTGEFTIKKLVFKEGENTLKLEAQSSLGTVLPIETTITYAPGGVVPTKKPIYQQVAFLYAGLTTLTLALLLGYLVYRKRKRIERFLEQLTRKQAPPTNSPVPIPRS
ncbi:MAG: hypothetical protein Q8O75_03860 [bacterium]|nr:hypothetical protein [bacterium]